MCRALVQDREQAQQEAQLAGISGGARRHGRAWRILPASSSTHLLSPLSSVLSPLCPPSSLIYPLSSLLCALCSVLCPPSSLLSYIPSLLSPISSKHASIVKLLRHRKPLVSPSYDVTSNNCQALCRVVRTVYGAAARLGGQSRGRGWWIMLATSYDAV